MREVKAVLYGVGAVGSLSAKFLLEKKGVKIVGAIDVAKDKEGKDLGQVLGLSKTLGIEVSRDVSSLLRQVKPDIAIHATSSYLRDTYPDRKSTRLNSSHSQISYA